MGTDLKILKSFLEKVDKTFPTPLSEKQELSEFAEKLCQKATLCAEYNEGEIVSLVAGYTENLTDNMAYISIAATLPEYRGRGLAKKLLGQFISICEDKGIAAVHLYAVRENTAAMNMYFSMGFEEWRCEDEQRPNDVHLIHRIRKGAEK